MVRKFLLSSLSALSSRHLRSETEGWPGPILFVILNKSTVILNLFQDLYGVPEQVRNDIKKRQAGFSTMEILIAAAILVVVFSAVIMLVLGGQKIAVDTQMAHEGQLLNTKFLEEARAASVNNFTFDVETLQPGSPVDGIYVVDLSSNYVTECVKEITARVDWTIEGKPGYVTNTTYISNPAVAFQTGTECNIPNDNDFAQCYLYGTADLEIEGQPSPNQDAYDLEVTRIDGTEYAFIVTHPSNSTQRPEDFWVYDISDNADPELTAYLDINADPNIGLNVVLIAASSGGSRYAGFY